METANIEGLKEVHGNIKELLTPSGDHIIIREQNGNDDDVLSNTKSARDGSSFNLFIQSIIVHSSKHNGMLSLDEVIKLPLRDKYFILIASRILSLGEELSFKYNWGTESEPDEQHYTEDLSLYLWDYDKEFPDENSPDHFVERIRPYPTKDTFMEFETPSGKTVRIDYLNGEGEKYLLGLGENDFSVNSILKARNIRLKQGDTYIPVKNFSVFSASDMRDIRSSVMEYDKEVNIMSELTHPTTGEKTQVSLIALPDFFFPLSI